MNDEDSTMNGSRGAALAIVLALTVALTVGCGGTGVSGGGPSGTGAGGGSLAGVEIRQYRGQKLGSIGDFRENSIKGPPTVDIATYRLKVDGLVSKPAVYRYEDIVSKETTYTKVVTLDCVEGWSVKALWEGVLLSDLIDRAGPRTDAVTVVFHAVDGYTTSLPLDYLRARKILLAYRLNGVRLPRNTGYPFIVVAEDRWGYKWCRWVRRIELSSDPDFEGYWEQRGYSRRGLLSNGPFEP